MSPEQIQYDGTLDERSDLFSIGILAYRMFTGKTPFADDAGEFLNATLEPTPPRQKNPSIPEPMEEIIMKLLQKNPDNRYQTAQDLLVDLHTVSITQ